MGLHVSVQQRSSSAIFAVADKDLWVKCPNLLKTYIPTYVYVVGAQ